MTTLTESATQAERVFTAAKHLVEFRDGLSGALLDLAEVTVEDDCDTAARRLSRLLTALGADESYRRGVQITTLAGGCWGLFPEIGDRRDGALHALRAVCHATATAVRDALHRDSCVCLGDDLRHRINNPREDRRLSEGPSFPGGIEL